MEYVLLKKPVLILIAFIFLIKSLIIL